MRKWENLRTGDFVHLRGELLPQEVSHGKGLGLLLRKMQQ